MLKSPGRLGRLGNAIMGRLSAAAAAAAATVYLLRATFTGANQSLADGDILSEGAGSLTGVDTSTGTVDIATNQLRVEGTTTTQTTGVDASVITGAAGKKMLATFQNVESLGHDPRWGMADQAATRYSNYYPLFYMTLAGATVFDMGDGAGGTTASFSSGSYTIDQALQAAIVLGGYDSAGAPSTSGTYGASCYVKDGAGSWTLLASYPSYDMAISLYPFLYQYKDGSRARTTIDDWIIPTAADTTVFTPTNYALDTFGGSGNLSVRTSDSGNSYTYVVQAGTVSGGNLNADAYGVLNSGEADSMTVIRGTLNANNELFGSLHRVVDGDNLLDSQLYYHTTAGLRGVYLYEKTGGVNTQRAFNNISGLTTGAHTLTTRIDGSGTWEVWVDGANKTSASGVGSWHPTGTQHGIRCSGTATIQDFVTLPLTATEYDTAFDTSALTAADCDLFHKFDAIDDVTLANGDVIYGGYVEDGSVEYFETGTPTVGGISSNTLRIDSPGNFDYGSWHSQGVTDIAAGSVLKMTQNKDGFLGSVCFCGLANIQSNNATGSSSNDYHLGFYSTTSALTAVFGDVAASSDFDISVGISPTASEDIELAFVCGGFDSAGVPDPAGEYGGHIYAKGATPTSGSWELLAAMPTDRYASEATLWASGTMTANRDIYYDNLKLPDSATTVEGVFTPTGYALDTFDEAGNPDLTAHTTDSGFTWSNLRTSASDKFVVDSTLKRVYRNAGTTPAIADSVDTGESAVFISSNVTVVAGSVGPVYRAVDNDNYFYIQYQPSANWKIYERTGGTNTQRASGTAPAAGTHDIAVRVSGNTQEAWINGGAKISYTSAVRNTATIHGITQDSNGASNASGFNTWYCLPITSATYTSELDGI